MNNNLRIACLIPLLSLLLLIPSVHADPLSQGDLGGGLSYGIDAPYIIKVGENASIYIEVRCTADKASISQISAQLYGGDILPNPYGTVTILAENVELSLFESINKTITVKAQKETTAACMINAQYDWTDFRGNHTNESASNTFFIPVRANTYDELSSSENTFRNLTYILTITTIAFIGTTIYAVIRKPKQNQETE